MSQAVTATGILIKRSPGSGTTSWVTIGEVDRVTPGEISRNAIETTTHNDGTESHVLGILRKSNPSFHINYVGSDATHASILSDIAGNSKNSWQIVFPSGVKRTGDAYVRLFKFDDVPVDAKQGAEIEIVWAGTVTEQSS